MAEESKIYSTDPIYNRRLLAQYLMKGAVDTSPVQSPWQGAARMAQALAGGLINNNEQSLNEEADRNFIAKLSGVSGAPAMNAPGSSGSPIAPQPTAPAPAAVNPAAPSRAEVPSSPTVWGDKEAEAAGLYEPTGSTTASNVPMPSPRPAMLAAALAPPPQPIAQPTNAAPSAGPSRAELMQAYLDPRVSSSLKAIGAQYLAPDEKQYIQTGDGNVLAVSKRGGTPQVVYQGGGKNIVVNGKLVNERTGQQIGDYSDDKFTIVEMQDGSKVAVSKTDPNKAIPIPGQASTPQNPYAPGPGKVPKDASDAANYSNRMAASHNIINQFSPSADESWGDYGKRMKDNAMVAAGTPGKILPGLPTNWAVSAERQQLEQAKRDFVNSTLRRESGAAISDSEFASAEKQYFPQPGDSPEVIRQKAANRERSIEGVMGGAGPHFKPPAEYKPRRNSDDGWQDMGGGVRIREKR